MNTWQQGRSSGGDGGDPRPGARGGYGGSGGAAGGAEPPLPPGLSPRGPRGAGAPGGQRPPLQRPAPGAAPGPGVPSQQPGGPLRPGGPAGPGRPGGPGGPGAPPQGRKRRRRRVVGYVALGLVGALLATGVGTYFWADSKLHHQDVLADYGSRPAAGKGTNWLIVGSDSRDGLSATQKQDLHTGSDDGKRSDSMMILHIGAHGNTLMSIPRDSWVPIPAHLDSSGSGKTIKATTSKINSAFDNGGGPLLVQTVEQNTGIHVDHYAEVGFAGFVGIVDAVGGVNMCIDQNIQDTDSGLNLKAGCQTLNGTQSLAFVRQRHQMADQDLGRMRNQQKFLSALAHQAASPGTLLDPFTLYPLIGSGLDTLIVDKNTGLTDLASLFEAMKSVSGGDGKSITIPIANADYRTSTGESAVKWNQGEATQVFDAIKNDTAVPSF
ncbi:LCP family protein [Kitasatospora sp. NBC_01287]|uniref:LCP family protein n=1 Tax=Kitasatospora sp. NBC_01287 TaxID=2903573 RepID=UPI002252C2F1|nr:LCP family protein [Kitasatospora sp. NBC_01287]MCX4748673.1 LCP family protein [Kitasatospora sp. NBC_01287]